MPSLLDVPRKKSVVVKAVAGDRAFCRRLMEMGLVPGTPVSVVGAALTGDPVTLQLRGGKLSLRRKEAQGVSVEAP